MVYERFRVGAARPRGQPPASPGGPDGAAGRRIAARRQSVSLGGCCSGPVGRTRPDKRSRPGALRGQQEHSDIRARSSFALPRLLAFYTARSRRRSGEPARSFLTEIFRHTGLHRGSSVRRSAARAPLRPAPRSVRCSARRPCAGCRRTRTSRSHGVVEDWRTRPTQDGSVPTTSTGVGNSPRAGSSVTTTPGATLQHPTLRRGDLPARTPRARPPSGW